MNKSKNAKFIALVTAFCIVIAYFSALSPTTAYFKEKQSKDINVSFSLLRTSETISNTALNFNFKAATKFEDFSEYLFDDVVYSQFITVSNTGEVPAKIYIDVTVPANSFENGLKYIIFPTTSSNLTPTFSVPAGTDPLKGDIKELVETRLYAYRNDFADGISESTAVEILNLYNSQFKNFSSAPLLPVGEYIGFQIYFWVEYGSVAGTINDTTEISTFSYNANVTIKALQNTAQAG